MMDEPNLLYEIAMLDDRFALPRWAYIRSELSHYLVERLRLQKAIEDEYGEYVWTRYEADKQGIS